MKKQNALSMVFGEIVIDRSMTLSMELNEKQDQIRAKQKKTIKLNEKQDQSRAKRKKTMELNEKLNQVNCAKLRYSGYE